MIKKTIIFWIIIFSLIPIVHWDYKEVVTTVLDNIQKTNNNKSDLQKKQNFQNYIPKIEKLTMIDQRVKDALIKYLNAKIDELKTVSQNKWLWEITNIDQEKIRTTRLKRHNDERATKNLASYSYETQLEQTATTRAQYLSQLNTSTHKRLSSDGYYNYDSIKERFENQWVTFPAEKNSASNFTENIAYRLNYSCKSSDCTDYLISRIKDWFDFFMSEKKANWPHYKAIIWSQYTKIGVGISINPSTKKIFIVTHYSVDF